MAEEKSKLIYRHNLPLSNVIRKRDLFESTVDKSSDGKSGCGALNDRRHPRRGRNEMKERKRRGEVTRLIFSYKLVSAEKNQQDGDGTCDGVWRHDGDTSFWSSSSA